MQAAQITKYGHADVVEVKEISVPAITNEQVLVTVHASSINPFDVKVREGLLKDTMQLPITLGGDIAGIVSKVGADVHHLQVGDRVFGQANSVAGNSGAFAEYAATKGGHLALAPVNIDFIHAAAAPLTGLSALQALTVHIKLQAGQKILIHGGAGGIGTIAIQLAKHIGAYVATTASGEGIDYVKELGADQVIDYKTEQFDELLHDFDAVFDTVGGETYERSYKVLKKGGIIVSMTVAADATLMDQYGVTAIAQQTHTSSEALDELRQHIEEGSIEIHVDAIFSLEDIQAAFKAQESGNVQGKVVLEIRPTSTPDEV